MGSDSAMQSSSKKRQRDEIASTDAKVAATTNTENESGSESDSESSSCSSSESESENENESGNNDDVKPTESKEKKSKKSSAVASVPAVKKLKSNAEGLNDDELEALKARKRAKTKAKAKARKVKQKAAGIALPKKKRKQQPESIENTNRDEDEVAGKADTRPPVDSAEAAAIAKINEESAKEGFNALRLFVGQLPYKATVGQVKEHFDKHGAGDVTVRLLTDKKTSKSRGVAFVELSDARQMVRALRVHHTRLDGKMINVERTCGGGGNNEKRKAKIKDLKELQGSKVGSEVKELAIEAVGAERAEKMDERVFEALTSFPRDVAKHMVTEFADSDLTNVRNPSAWFMGLVKRYRMKLQDGEDLMGDGAGEAGSSSNRQSQSSYRGGAAKSRGGSAGGRGGRGGASSSRGRGGSSSSGRGSAQSNSWNSRSSSNTGDSRSSSYSNERSYSGGNDYNNESSNNYSYGGGEGAEADAVPKRTRGSKGRKKSKGGKALSEW